MKNSHLLVGVSCIVMSYTAMAAETTTFQYDAQGRLIQSTRSGGPADGVVKVTSFDFAGNRTNQTVTGASSGLALSSPLAPSNNPPAAITEYGSMQVCTISTFNVTENHTDPGGDMPLFLISASGPLSPIVTGANSIRVTSESGTGEYAITYTIQDAQGVTADGILNVDVSGGSCA